MIGPLLIWSRMRDDLSISVRQCPLEHYIHIRFWQFSRFVHVCKVPFGLKFYILSSMY